VHNTTWLYVFYMLQEIGLVLWRWSMYMYIPGNYPTRMRSLGTGWTDGIGHLGAWGGVLIAGALFSATSPGSWIVFITIPCSILPGMMVAVFGKRQRNRALEELSRELLGRRLFPEVSAAAQPAHPGSRRGKGQIRTDPAGLAPMAGARPAGTTTCGGARPPARRRLRVAGLDP
jgi:MFS family permease